jgi:hypothetical protein
VDYSIAGIAFPRYTSLDMPELPQSIRRPDPPCVGVRKDVAEAWVESRIVAEVAYVEARPGGVLRHAEFVRFRTDKSPQECDLPPAFRAGIEGRSIHKRRLR